MKLAEYLDRPISFPFLRGAVLGAFRRLFPGMRLGELVFHIPASVVDRSNRALVDGAVCSTRARVLGVAIGRGKSPWRVMCQAEGGELLDLVFFNMPPYMRAKFKEGAGLAVSGKVQIFGGRFAMAHPYVAAAGEIDTLAAAEPVYPLTYALTNRTLRRAAQAALAGMPEAEHEWQEGAKISFCAALRRLHSDPYDTEARRRIAFDEALANQLSLATARAGAAFESGAVVAAAGEYERALRSAFGYCLTGAQERAVAEITADMAGARRMFRMLQGDVGCGKTAVAFLASARAAEAGFQTAIMCPTEILAAQHFESLSRLLRAAGLPDMAVKLTSRDKGREREKKLALIAGGAARIIVGTHSLIEEDVEFKSLGLAIIDEQHKFGVRQRKALAGKGAFARANVLMMSATPIPRTLAMTLYGDADLSTIDEMPEGRVGQKTLVIPASEIGALAADVKRRIDSGEVKKTYWVCPLVAESDKLELAVAEARYEDLKRVFGDSVVMAHGQMKAEDKERALASFAAEDGAKVLLATTIVEVGVNVPAANLMIIEEAQRFGLAALHQLRGRIGRGGGEAVCILAHNGRLSETARARLGIMKATTDGFRIAEEDLRLRGGGDIAGVRQSGALDFMFADAFDAEMLAAAKRRAAALVGTAAGEELLKVFV